MDNLGLDPTLTRTRLVEALEQQDAESTMQDEVAEARKAQRQAMYELYWD